jgi:hypothetical protein
MSSSLSLFHAERLHRQGDCILILGAHDDAEEVVMVPAGREAFVLDAQLLGAVLLEQIGRDVMQARPAR